MDVTQPGRRISGNTNCTLGDDYWALRCLLEVLLWELEDYLTNAFELLAFFILLLGATVCCKEPKPSPQQ